MERGTCIICGTKTYNLICDKCLHTFEWHEYEHEIEYATYDCSDDKLRIYSGRVSEPLFAALATIGFQRAPAQGCFYGTWSPTKEDAALELCDEITDEETTMEDRAADRSERFATYGDNAKRRAKSLSDEANKIAERFYMGQPILCGHHSEKRMRRDQERMHNKTRVAIAEFDRGDYWKQRAANAERHAEYMKAKHVVINRIKKLESYIRKEKKEQAEAETALKVWGVENITREQAVRAANWYSISKSFTLTEYPRDEHTYEGPMSLYSALDFITPEQAQEIAVRVYLRSLERHGRWTEHYESQLAYWKTFLADEHGADIDQQRELKKGQWVAVMHYDKPRWAQIQRVNKGAEGRITTVSVMNEKGARHYTNKWPYESIKAIFDHEPTLTEVSEALGLLDKPLEVRQEPQPDPEREALEAKAEQLEKMEVVVNYDPDFFPTPMPLVWRMVELADIQARDVVLEPSAGDGRIAQYVLEHEPRPLSATACEINAAALRVISEIKGLSVHGYDFLDFTVGGFTKIVMNPPFSKEQDILHVQHAWDLLAPGGRIVAIMSEHAWVANNLRCTQFRDWLDDLGAMVEELPEGTFKESGTMVRARLVVIDKPVNIDTPVVRESSVVRGTQQELWAAFQ